MGQIGRFRGGSGWILAAAASTTAASLPAASGTADGTYVPTDDTTIVEQLPTDTRALLSRILGRDPPTSAPSAAPSAKTLALAREALASARRRADPRRLGYVETLLRPWWDDAEAPSAVRVLRDAARQSGHDLAAALNDLDRVLAQAPGDAEARLMRAMILQAQGRPRAALAECARLVMRVPALVLTTCSAVPAQQLGRGRPVAQALRRILAEAPDLDPALATWAYRTLARVAETNGDLDLADQALVQALSADPEDAASQLDHLDLLLRRGRPGRVVERLDGTRLTPMRELRLAEAKRALRPRPADTETHVERLRRHFATREALGDRRHLREAARAHLGLFDDPAKALALAQANWVMQREPEDARLLLAAAGACGRPQAAEPVRRWIGEEGIAVSGLDPELAALAGEPEAERDHP